MSFHRATIVALTAVFTVAMTSLAAACCVVTVTSGHTNSPNPVPIAPGPIYVGPWSGGWSLTPQSFGASLDSSDGCGCGAAASPFYVVDQGPTYTGPNVMRPFLTYTPPAIRFPYVSDCCVLGVVPSRQPPLVRKAGRSY